MSEFFSDKLKKLRLSKNLTQDQLAKLIYVSRSAVAKWEQNRGFPNIDALQRISKIFEVSIDDLLSDKELKILEVTNNKKKISLQRKIIISLSILTAIILIVFISLTVIYHPRTISKYVKSNSNNNFVKIEIVNYDEDIIVIEKNKANSFLNEILAIKVIPSYLFVQKAVSSYTVNLYYDDTVYQLNNYYIYDGKTRTYFNIVNGNIYDLVNKYTN